MKLEIGLPCPLHFLNFFFKMSKIVKPAISLPTSLKWSPQTNCWLHAFSDFLKKYPWNRSITSLSRQQHRMCGVCLPPATATNQRLSDGFPSLLFFLSSSLYFSLLLLPMHFLCLCRFVSVRSNTDPYRSVPPIDRYKFRYRVCEPWFQLKICHLNTERHISTILL